MSVLSRIFSFSCLSAGVMMSMLRQSVREPVEAYSFCNDAEWTLILPVATVTLSSRRRLQRETMVARLTGLHSPVRVSGQPLEGREIVRGLGCPSEAYGRVQVHGDGGGAGKAGQVRGVVLVEDVLEGELVRREPRDGAEKGGEVRGVQVDSATDIVHAEEEAHLEAKGECGDCLFDGGKRHTSEGDAEHAQAWAAVDPGAKAGDVAGEGQLLEHGELAFAVGRQGELPSVHVGDAEHTQVAAAVEKGAKAAVYSTGEGQILKGGQLAVRRRREAEEFFVPLGGCQAENAQAWTAVEQVAKIDDSAGDGDALGRAELARRRRRLHAEVLCLQLDRCGGREAGELDPVPISAVTLHVRED